MPFFQLKTPEEIRLFRILAEYEKFDIRQRLESIRKFKSLALEVLKHFGCKRCGMCCRQEPCMLSDEEVATLCKFLHVPPEEFDSRFLDHRSTYLYLKTPCPFLRGNECTVYEARPIVCRLYPFGSTGFITHCPMGIEIIEAIEAEFPQEKLRAQISEEELAKFEDSVRLKLKNEIEFVKTIAPPVEEKFIKQKFVTSEFLEVFLKYLKHRTIAEHDKKPRKNREVG